MLNYCRNGHYRSVARKSVNMNRVPIIRDQRKLVRQIRIFVGEAGSVRII
jgi:hypothetical protein